MGISLYWAFKKNKDSEALDLENQLNEDDLLLITADRRRLRHVFHGVIPGTQKIFEEADIDDGVECYSFVSLKDLLKNLEDRKYYNIRKEYLFEGEYEKIINLFKSLDKYGNPDDVQIGLATD